MRCTHKVLKLHGKLFNIVLIDGWMIDFMFAYVYDYVACTCSCLLLTAPDIAQRPHFPYDLFRLSEILKFQLH